MLPWLWSVLDVDSSPEVYARYDRMSAKELFQRFRPRLHIQSNYSFHAYDSLCGGAHAAGSL